jgi:hypothetical protein
MRRLVFPSLLYAPGYTAVKREYGETAVERITLLVVMPKYALSRSLMNSLPASGFDGNEGPACADLFS